MDITEYIVEEIDEVGEVPFVFLIPKYRELNLKKSITYPITDFEENYLISDTDFKSLRNELISLLSEKRFGLYKYKSGATASEKWEDSFELLSAEETNEIIENKSYWHHSENNSSLFVSDIE